MKNAALVLLLAAVPAVAQNRAAEIDFENALRETQAAAAAARNVAAVERTLVAMNDGVGAGERVVAHIRENAVRIIVAAQAEAVKTEMGASGAVISLSDALPAYPRVYGPLIASEIARQMLADMPASAERAYMRRATAGRVWIELGGTPSSLPVIEPLAKAEVQALHAEFSSWATQDAQTALGHAGAAENLPMLHDLMNGADAEQRAAIEAANRRFVDFLIEERFVRPSPQR